MCCLHSPLQYTIFVAVDAVLQREIDRVGYVIVY